MGADRPDQAATSLARVADAVVHDLGNLLAVVAGQMSLLEPLVRADPQGRESIAEIRRSVTACVARLHELTAAIRQTSAPSSARLGQPMVLLTEPDPSVSGLVESLLGSFGCQVIVRPVASEALDYAAHNDIDLVIAGTHPAQISDIYFIEEIRKRRPALPAIVMSEFASPPPPTDDGRAPTEFLNKPFAMADLAAMVRRLLAK